MSDPEIQDDDERWLAALAGRAEPNADDPETQEAMAVRAALQARARQLMETVPEADDALLQRVLFRLRRERLAGKRNVLTNPASLALAASFIVGIGLAFSLGRFTGSPITGDFALTDSAAISVDAPSPHDDAFAFATLVAASEPEARAAELIAGMPVVSRNELLGSVPGSSAAVGITPYFRERWSWLDPSRWGEALGSLQALSGLFREQVRAGIPVVVELGQDRFILVVEATDAMVEYLRLQDIEPIVTDGEIVLVIYAD